MNANPKNNDIAVQNRHASRPIFQRQNENSIIISALSPGENTPGCCEMCHAPTCLPCLSTFPCWGEAQYVAARRDASKYVYVRENSIEYNDPIVAFKVGKYCCVDPCEYVIQDNITVIYYDDPLFQKMTNKVDYFSACCILFFGGNGEKITFQNTCCLSLCTIGLPPCPFVPRCCPSWCCPCYLRREIYFQDSQKAIYEIRKARDAAMGKHKDVSKTSEPLNRIKENKPV